MVPASETFLLIVGAIASRLPQLQTNPSVALKVYYALADATISEWTSFKQNNSKEIFYATSRYSWKVGARDSRYAKVRHLLTSGRRLH